MTATHNVGVAREIWERGGKGFIGSEERGEKPRGDLPNSSMCLVKRGVSGPWTHIRQATLFDGFQKKPSCCFSSGGEGIPKKKAGHERDVEVVIQTLTREGRGNLGELFWGLLKYSLTLN